MANDNERTERPADNPEAILDLQPKADDSANVRGGDLAVTLGNMLKKADDTSAGIIGNVR